MTQAATVASALRAKLTLIRGTEALGTEYVVDAEETTLGGDGSDIAFENDSTLSPIHCRLLIRDGGLWLEDVNSHNGTYLRVRRAARLKPGDAFLAGEQVLRFELDEPLAADTASERFCGTPAQPYKFAVYQILAGGRPGLFMPSQRRSLTLGREGADLEFPWDPYMSGKHCKITEKDGHYYLVDHDSRNGTFLRIPPGVSVPLQPGDFVFIGRQLIRVDAD